MPQALIGRDASIGVLKRVLEDARVGSGGVVLITGEPGIGKTSLVSAGFRLASGFRRVWAWCADAPAGDALQPWRQIVRSLASVSSGTARLIDSSPLLGGLVGRDRSTLAVPTDSDVVRWQLGDAVSDLVRIASEAEPLLIVLDDLHDAQASSLWLLAHLVATLRSSAALVLATARDSEAAWCDRTEARAALERQATIVRLGPFTTRDIADLLPAFGPASDRDAVAARIFARTGGNPLLAAELVRTLPSTLPLTLALDASALTSGVPVSVRVITAERLRGCSPDARRVVAGAAVLGTRFALDHLADLVGMDIAAARRGLGELEALGIVEFPESGSGQFRHALVRDAVYESLPAAEQTAWHARAAEILIAAAERGRPIAAAEIAQHLRRAGPELAERAVEYAVLAGDRAVEVLAFEDAVGWYARALQTLEALGDPKAPTEWRAAIALALGEARRGAGDRDGAREQLLQSAMLARRANRPDLLARAALALGSGVAGFEVELLDRAQVDLLEEAETRLAEEHAGLRALVMARLSLARARLDSSERRLDRSFTALRLARDAQNDLAQAAALATLCDALAGPAHTAERSGYACEIVACAERTRSPALELLGHRLRLVALLEVGDRSAAEDEITAYRIRTETFRHPLYTWYLDLWRGMWALAEGRFDECRTHNDRVHAASQSAGSHNAFLLWVTQRWCLMVEAEQLGELRELSAAVDFDQEDAVWGRISGMLVQAQLGDLDAARRELDALAPRLAFLPLDSEWLPCVAQVAEAIALVGPHPLARWVYSALEPYADLFVVEGIGAAIRGPVQRFLALAAFSQGDVPRARAHFARAIAAMEAFGAPGLLARMQREWLRLTADSPVHDAPSHDAQAHVFRRHGDIWSVQFGDRTVQLRDSKGLQDLAVLLARPAVYVGALDLMGARTDGDAGEVLDAPAREAYRRRLLELEVEAADADALADVGRSAQIADERAALVAQLSAAYGLGGRARRVGSDAERARTAVTARIRETIRRIAAVHPELGGHLERSVRTGTFCVYLPERRTTWDT